MSSPANVPASRLILLLVLLWTLLGLRMVAAVVGREPLGGELALPSLSFFVLSAVLGSRAYGAFLDRAGDARHGR